MLAIAVSLALAGCGGGGSSSGPDVSAPPANPGTGNGGGTGNDGTAAAAPDPAVVDQGPAAKVEVGVIDSGANTRNATISDSVSKVLKFDYVSGAPSKVTDISSADAATQEMAASHHGTFVSQIIAGNTAKGSTAGGALGIADIYAAQTTINAAGNSYAHVNFEAMRHLQEKFGVQLFNGSWGNTEDGLVDPLSQQFASEVVENGGLIVVAAGNEAKLTSSDISQMPSYVDSLEQGFLTVVGLDEAHTDLYYYSANRTGSNACGHSASRWCLASDYVNGPYYDSDQGSQLFGGTSGAA
ncbi:MAG: S8 family serine peptidase, partial [Acinetobacter sp.]|nr:S8 family serine peptidase [Acinetobacter sp.]